MWTDHITNLNSINVQRCQACATYRLPYVNSHTILLRSYISYMLSSRALTANKTLLQAIAEYSPYTVKYSLLPALLGCGKGVCIAKLVLFRNPCV